MVGAWTGHAQRPQDAAHVAADRWKDAASEAMDRYASGDDAAFSRVYDLLAPRLSSFLMRRTRDAAKTEDLVQQTFLRMHCARRHFSRGAAVTPWAFAIARRLLIDVIRKGRYEPIAFFEDEGDERESPAPGASPDEVAARRRIERRVNEAPARVSESDRTAFELVKCDGLSMTEAGEVLGITSNAVKLRAYRTYQALRVALGDEVREELEGA